MPGSRPPSRLAATVVTCALLTAAAGARDAVLEGQSFDDTLELQRTPLHLNGLGLRGVAWIKAFVAGLYVPHPSSDAQALLQDDGAKRLRLKIMLDAPAEELSKAIRNGLRKNLGDDEMKRVQPQADELDARVRALGDLHVGDVIDLDWHPGRGVVLDVNGRVRGAAIPGYELYRGILKIFIGERPVDKRLKAGLLSGGVAGGVAGGAASRPAATTGSQPASAPASVPAPAP